MFHGMNHSMYAGLIQSDCSCQNQCIDLHKCVVTPVGQNSGRIMTFNVVAQECNVTPAACYKPLPASLGSWII